MAHVVSYDAGNLRPFPEESICHMCYVVQTSLLRLRSFATRLLVRSLEPKK